MQTRLTLIGAFAAFALFVSIARAENIESGPEVGKKTPELKLTGVVGSNEGKEFEAAADRGEKPTVYIFIHADRWGRPTARFLKVLDTAVNDLGKDSHIIAVWLTDDVDKTKGYLPKAQMSIQLQASSLAVYVKDAAGPADWSLADKADVTAVVAHGGKVSARFGYESPNDTLVREVEAALKKGL